MKRIILGIVVVMSAGTGLYAAQQNGQQSDAEKKIVVAARAYTPEQQKKLDELNAKLKTVVQWQARRELIRTAIEQENFHPDDIYYWFSPPLHDAVRESDKDFVHYLLARGANPNQKPGGEFYPLSLVQTASIAQLLIAYKANVHLFKHESEYGDNLLSECSIEKDPRLALVYFKAGVDPKNLNKYGTTILMDHARRCVNACWTYPGAIKIIVKIGAPLDTRASNGQHVGKNYQEILQARLESQFSSEQQKAAARELLGAIEQAKQEVDAAKAERNRGLPNELLKWLPVAPVIKGPVAIVLGYNDPKDHILPMSIVRALEELDKEEQALQKELGKQ